MGEYVSIFLFSVVFPDLYFSWVIFKYPLDDGFYNLPVAACKAAADSLRECGCLVSAAYRQKLADLFHGFFLKPRNQCRLRLFHSRPGRRVFAIRNQRPSFYRLGRYLPQQRRRPLPRASSVHCFVRIL